LTCNSLIKIELYTKSNELDVDFLFPIASQPYSSAGTQKVSIRERVSRYASRLITILPKMLLAAQNKFCLAYCSACYRQNEGPASRLHPRNVSSLLKLFW